MYVPNFFKVGAIYYEIQRHLVNTGSEGTRHNVHIIWVSIF